MRVRTVAFWKGILIDLLQWRLVRYVVPIVVAVGYLVFSSEPVEVRRPLGVWLDPWLVTFTFGFSGMTFLNQLRRDLEEGLPKSLWVDFVFHREVAIRVEDAVLYGEGDIRAMSQQFGKQLNGNHDLVLSRFWPLEAAVVRAGGTRIKRYRLRIDLGKLPEPLAKPDGAERGMLVRRQTDTGIEDIVCPAVRAGA
jgi:hypothetical protein